MNDPAATERGMRMILSMIGELHGRGYQRLRIVPGMAPSGAHWRCAVTPASNTSRRHGAQVANWHVDGDLIARYTSGRDGTVYFGWTDRTDATSRILADTFVERFPRLCEASLGPDPRYAGWFNEMLGLAENGWFPIFYADYEIDQTHGVYLVRTDRLTTPRPTLPFPPPGEADDGPPTS